MYNFYINIDMKQLKYKLFTCLWIVPMFSFGFAREWNNHTHKLNKQSQKSDSIFNGLYYISPFGLFKLYHFSKRLEFDYKKKNNIMIEYNKYNHYCYYEYNGYNKNLFY